MQFSPLTSITPKSKFKNITASNLIYTGQGVVVGVVVNSNTSGTLKIYNGVDTGGVVMFNTITIGTGERFIPLFGAEFGQGLYIVVGGTTDVTILYN